jgi:hypothetical protein
MIEYGALLDTGVLGIMLAWFMFRMEKQVKQNTLVLQSVAELLRKIRFK